MFCFNHLKKLILKIRVNLVLSKILYLKLLTKKYKEEISLKYFVVKL